MDSDNWVVSNLQGALDTWNEKMGEIVGLLTASPADFRGGGIWDAVLSIHGAVQAVALALLVLFFLSGLVKTCGSFAEAKRPEVVLKLFVRFVLAHAAVVYGLELMMAFLDVVQGLKSEDKWYGVTYKEDKPVVVAAIQKLKDEGRYPQKLWED